MNLQSDLPSQEECLLAGYSVESISQFENDISPWYTRDYYFRTAEYVTVLACARFPVERDLAQV